MMSRCRSSCAKRWPTSFLPPYTFDYLGGGCDRLGFGASAPLFDYAKGTRQPADTLSERAAWIFSNRGCQRQKDGVHLGANGMGRTEKDNWGSQSSGAGKAGVA